MQLTEEQKQQVARWIADGQKLTDVQRRLDEEFGVRLTYMETRFLIDDLRLTPLDPPAPPAPAPEEVPAASPLEEPAAGPGGVMLKVDELTRPGTVVSGTVVFSDGGEAIWYLDQTGRLGMQPAVPGYKPPEPDVAEFQIALERELVRLGM